MIAPVVKLAREQTEASPSPRRLNDPLSELAERAAAGEPEATTALIMELGGGMLRTVRKVLGAYHPDVEDVTQDAVLGLLKSLKSFRAECSVGHFANQVALRRALHARRHFAVRDRVGDLSVALDDPADTRQQTRSPLEDAVSRERRRIVRRLLGQLSEPIAEALAMHFMLGYTVDEIATLVDVSSNTVWSRLKLGKKALRRALDEDDALCQLLREGES